MPTGHSAVAPELGAVCLSLPSLIGPAEHLGILARAECHTNEAVLLLGPGLVALRGTALRWRALHAAHRLRGHRRPLLPRATSPCPAPAPRPALQALTLKRAPTGQRSFVILRSLTPSQSSQFASPLAGSHGGDGALRSRPGGTLQHGPASLLQATNCPTVPALFTVIYSGYICIYVIRAALTNAR